MEVEFITRKLRSQEIQEKDVRKIGKTFQKELTENVYNFSIENLIYLNVWKTLNANQNK